MTHKKAGHPKGKRFQAEVIEGHKGVVAVIVPFDPEDVLGHKPVRLAGRRHGWLIEGSVSRVAFAGYVGERWGRFFVMLDDGVRRAAGIEVGDTVSVVVRPSASPKVLADAIEQSKRTTQPSRARADAVVMPQRGRRIITA